MKWHCLFFLLCCSYRTGNKQFLLLGSIVLSHSKKNESLTKEVAVLLSEYILKFMFSYLWLLHVDSLHTCSPMRARCLCSLQEKAVIPTQRRTGGNRHRLKHMEFHLNARRHSFTVQVVKYGNCLPRDVAESPSVEILKSSLDMVLGNLLEKGGRTGRSQALPILWFCDSGVADSRKGKMPFAAGSSARSLSMLGSRVPLLKDLSEVACALVAAYQYGPSHIISPVRPGADQLLSFLLLRYAMSFKQTCSTCRIL